MYICILLLLLLFLFGGVLSYMKELQHGIPSRNLDEVFTYNHIWL